MARQQHSINPANKQEHQKNLIDVLNLLEKVGYCENQKLQIFQEQTKKLGHAIDENGIKANGKKRKTF